MVELTMLPHTIPVKALIFLPCLLHSPSNGKDETNKQSNRSHPDKVNEWFNTCFNNKRFHFWLFRDICGITDTDLNFRLRWVFPVGLHLYNRKFSCRAAHLCGNKIH